MPSRPAQTSTRRSPRPEPPRGRRYSCLWLLVVILALAAAYFTLPRPAPPAQIGIVAGHWQNDSGATCPSGLREVDITLPVAQKVVGLLQEQGYQAEVLPEYGDRLAGYRGIAFVSLHADSCLPEISGYKIAGSARGPAASESARLVESLTGSYAAVTGLRFHANTITPAMTNYHAFSQIDPGTPAAIVEMGFMGGDGGLLTGQQDRVAQGIASGIVSYLRASGSATRTPTPRR